MPENNNWITAQQLAEILDLSVETIWKYTRENKIPYIQLGNRQYRYNLDEIIENQENIKIKEKKQKYKVNQSKNCDNEENITYQDYLKIPEEPGYQLEVLEGMLVKEPSPNIIHQRISRRLQRMLEDYFWEIDPEGEILNAPLDVTFNDTTVVQPDLIYITGNQQNLIKEKRIDGSPRLVVEIISPYSSRKDRIQKMNIYQKAKIKHYWLVNPEDKTFAKENK